MEKNTKVVLSSDDNNKEVEFNLDQAYEFDYVKSMIRDGVVQVKMPIKVKCDYNDLETMKEYLTLRNGSDTEKFEKYHNNLFSVSDDEKMKRFFSFIKCSHFLRAYNILDIATDLIANEINLCDSKEEICKKFKIPEILVEDK